MHELKHLCEPYPWYERIYDSFFYWFIALHHPKKVMSAIAYDHDDVRDMYGCVLADDVEPARETIEMFNEFVDCEAGDYIEIIVIK